jgi:hypothetical protein
MGIPNLLGFLAATLLGFFFNAIFRVKCSAQTLAGADLFSGFAAVFAGICLVRIAGLQPEMWLPMLSTIWFAIHFWLNDGFSQFVLSSAGVLGGWFLYLHF